MPVSAYMPDVVVEIAFNAGYTTAAASRTWTDVSAYVEAQSVLNITRGRPDQFSAPQPSRLSLTLDNTDGRFTPENTAGAYYPNVKKGRPIRVRVKPVGAGAYVDRFLGYIDEWPVQWPDNTSAMSTVTITATSRQARLGRSAPFKSIVEEEILYDGADLYFPLGEPQGSTTAGNIAPGRSDVLTVTQIGTGGPLTFGEGTGPGTDDLTAPVFAPADPPLRVNGNVLAATLVTPLMAAGDTTLEFECFINTTSTLGRPIMIGDPYGTAPGVYPFVSFNINALGTAQVWFDFDPSGTDLVVNGSTVNDGANHHLAGRLVITGGTATVSIMVDGGSRVSNSVAYTGPALAFRSVVVGGLAGDLIPATISHVAIRSGTAAMTDARIQVHAQAGLTGFAGEASGARIQRYARLAGLPTAEVSVETGLSTSVAHKDTTGEQPSALMQDVADTEDGVVFDGKDGTLTFHARSHRYNATSAFTLSTTAGDVEGGLTPKLDDQHLTNDMTASRPNGLTVRSTNDASIAEYGYYRETVEILTTSDNEVQSRADWEVNRFGTPRVTVPNLAVDLLTCSSGLITSLLAADIGTKFTVTGLPSQAPSSTMTFFIEGISERIGAESYGIEFNVSAAAYANVWTLDSSTLSQLDSTTVLAY